MERPATASANVLASSHLPASSVTGKTLRYAPVMRLVTFYKDLLADDDMEVDGNPIITNENQIDPDRYVETVDVGGRMVFSFHDRYEEDFESSLFSHLDNEDIDTKM
ncbi:hypothetical protein ACLMJK_009500 [Lecanora helva]